MSLVDKIRKRDRAYLATIDLSNAVEYASRQYVNNGSRVTPYLNERVMELLAMAAYKPVSSKGTIFSRKTDDDVEVFLTKSSEVAYLKMDENDYNEFLANSPDYMPQRRWAEHIFIFGLCGAVISAAAWFNPIAIAVGTSLTGLIGGSATYLAERAKETIKPSNLDELSGYNIYRGAAALRMIHH
jgi:hypothetical protein